MQFFLHGSMGSEIVPEAVLRAFIKTYPDLFPTADLTHLGVLSDEEFGWPIGFSRSKVKHFGNLSSIGLNCAACHVAQITSTRGGEPVRILGVTSHFDAEAFFGSLIVATFRTAEPANMKNFLLAYIRELKPKLQPRADFLNRAWALEQKKITELLSADPFASKGVEPGELHELSRDDVQPKLERIASSGLGPTASLVSAMLKLFHNIRAALHVPDTPPEKPPPASGPGRNDAFGLLSAGLFHAPQPYAPAKFGLVWNVAQRHWVHWDANTRSPIGRNLLASLGLGAPLHGKRTDLQFALVKRQTDLTEQIRPPRYPFAIDQDAAARGAAHFQSKCVSCHGGEESDKRLFDVAVVGTDPQRARVFTEKQAERFNKFLAELEAVGYEAPKEAGLRGTGKYWAATLSGVWARSPYLHNGSVRTMAELLTPPEKRARTFHRGSHRFDEEALGYSDEGAYVFDTSAPGNSNSGHDYATKLSEPEKRDLIEYLKTL